MNGWKNYKTWAIANELQNDEYLYTAMCKYQKPTYKGFIEWTGLTDKRWFSKKLAYAELDELIVTEE